MPQVFHALQNGGNRLVVPMVGVGGDRIADNQPVGFPVGGGVQHLLFLQTLCNLHWPKPSDTKAENLPYHLCGFLVHQPTFLVLRVFSVPIGGIVAQPLSGAALCPPHGPDFLAGVPCVPFVE